MLHDCPAVAQASAAVSGLRSSVSRVQICTAARIYDGGRQMSSHWQTPWGGRVMLWLSVGRNLDGLWVGSYFQTNAEGALRRVEAALRLIKSNDRRRYDRMIHDLDRVWVRLLTTGAAQFDPSLRACLLDERFLLAETTDPELIAAMIVHEATHARLWRCGIRYDGDRRRRIEAICFRRELAFARRLPNGQSAREAAEDALAMGPSYWTNVASQDREVEGSIQVLRHLEPNWLARLVLAVHNWRTSRPRRVKRNGERG